MIGGAWLSQAIRVACELGVADRLNQGALTAGELAKLVDADELSLYRLLRALANFGIFKELKNRRFELNAMGRCLRSDDRHSVRDMARFQGGFHWPHWGELLYSVKTGKTSVSKIEGTEFFEFISKK